MAEEPSKPNTYKAAAIKIAPQEASQRSSAGGAADPGPGDPNAEPSSMPMAVDIPTAPTASQLVVPASTAASTNQEDGAQFSRRPSSMGPAASSPGGASPSTGVSVAGAEGSVKPSTGFIEGRATSSSHNVSQLATPSVGNTGLPAASQSPGPSSPGTDTDSQAGSTPASSPRTPSSAAETSPASTKSSSPVTSPGGTTTTTGGKKGKKVTRFRYHKRIVVRTHGKTNPASIMAKVNKKDEKAGVSVSNIEQLDPDELMKRAGVKDKGKGTHWRVRLRQTKRVTKDGKTTTQTKVAYRDSEGNKKVRVSATPNCKRCNKKLEECRCEDPSSKSKKE